MHTRLVNEQITNVVQGFGDVESGLLSLMNKTFINYYARLSALDGSC